MSTEGPRPRRVNLGEVIALGALIVSAVGVWIAWKSGSEDKATRIIEQRQPIPLTLRAKREDDGTRLEITPVESSHALQSLTVTLPNASPISIGSEGELRAKDVESALMVREKEPRDRTFSVRARIDARYVEMGKDRRASGSYTIRYMWKGGGLFGGRSLHLVSLSR